MSLLDFLEMIRRFGNALGRLVSGHARPTLAICLPMILALNSVILKPVGDAFSSWVSAKDWNNATGFVVLVLSAVSLVAANSLLQKASRDTIREPVEPATKSRKRLCGHVSAFAQSLFDAGLFGNARGNFPWTADPTFKKSNTRDKGPIEEYFCRADGPLLILGEPGTGKSTLVYELALLVQPRNDHDPIVVPFELSRWTGTHDTIEGWMADELKRKYEMGSSLAKRWIESELVIPMLDGLDEIPSTRRQQCVDSINEYLKSHPSVKTVVSSRLAEYQELRRPLDIGSQIHLLALSRANVEVFLNAHPEQFTTLKQALHQHSALWSLLTTPLMLWVANEALNNSANRKLPQSGPGIRKLLFELYIEKMLQRESEKRLSITFLPSDARRWLVELAEAMNRAGVSAFHLEDLSLAWVPAAERQQATTALRVFLGVGFALSFGFLGFIFSDHLWRLILQLASSAGTPSISIPEQVKPSHAMLLGGAFGLVYGTWLTTITPDEIFLAEPIDATGWSWERAWQSFPGALVRALSRPFWSVMLVSFTLGSWAGFHLWIAFGLLVGVSNSLFLGIVTNQVRERVRVNSGFRRSAMYALVTAMLVLAVAITTSLLSYQATGALRTLCSLAGVLFFVAAPMYGYRLGGKFCIKHVCVRATLVHRRHIPMRLVQFLDFAVQRVIMLRVGGTFRFIHREVQEYLLQSAKKKARLRGHRAAV